MIFNIIKKVNVCNGIVRMVICGLLFFFALACPINTFADVIFKDEYDDKYYTDNDNLDLPIEGYLYLVEKDGMASYEKEQGNKIKLYYITDINLYQNFIFTQDKLKLLNNASLSINDLCTFDIYEVPNTGSNENKVNDVSAVWVNHPKYYVHYPILEDISFFNDQLLNSQCLKNLSKSNLKQFLLSKGIDTRVETVSLIDSPQYDLTALLKTEAGNYYIVFKGNSDDLNSSVLCNETEFRNLSMPQKKQLFFNDDEIDNEGALSVGCCTYVKLRPFIEKISNKPVVWNNERKSVLFYIGLDKYEFVLADNCYYKNDDNVKLKGTVISAYAKPIMIQGTMYFNAGLLDGWIKEYDDAYTSNIEESGCIVIKNSKCIGA